MSHGRFQALQDLFLRSLHNRQKGEARASRLGPHPITHTQKESVGSLGTQQSGNRLQHDPRIEREGTVLGVGQIQVDGLIPGEVGTARNLPQAGDAGADGELAHDARLVLRDLAGERGGAGRRETYHREER